MLRERVVVVRHIPETFTRRGLIGLFKELKGCLDVDRPSLVLDCSQLRQMNRQILFILLSCLEEAMKRNGDVRLAAVSPQAKAALKATGADILFRFFETTADAVASFQRRVTTLPSHASASCSRESTA